MNAFGAPALRAAAVLLAAALCASCASRGPRQGEEAPSPARDATLAQASTSARLALGQGDLATAGKLYRLALARAREIDDAALAADMAYNLAVVEIAAGRHEAADRLLYEAHYDAVRSSTGTLDIALVIAKNAYLRGRPAQASALAAQIGAVAEAPPALRMQALILRGQIDAEGGDARSARAALRAVAQLAAASRTQPVPAVGADLAKLEGTIARVEGEPALAARAFEREADLLRTAGRFRDMSHAYARAAAAHEAAAQPSLAADRYYLAARSIDGHGDAALARTFVAAGLQAARSAGDDDARERLRVLADELSRRARP